MTIATALPVLLKLSKPSKVNPRALLGCAYLPRFHEVPDTARGVPTLDWSICPLDLFDHPLLSSVFVIDELARVAPLGGWPDRFVAWAVNGLLIVRRHGGF